MASAEAGAGTGSGEGRAETEPTARGGGAESGAQKPTREEGADGHCRLLRARTEQHERMRPQELSRAPPQRPPATPPLSQTSINLRGLCLCFHTAPPAPAWTSIGSGYSLRSTPNAAPPLLCPAFAPPCLPLPPLRAVVGVEGSVGTLLYTSMVSLGQKGPGVRVEGALPLTGKSGVGPRARVRGSRGVLLTGLLCQGPGAGVWEQQARALNLPKLIRVS